MEETAHNGKSVLITGGTSGLGLELVKVFHDKGFDVICTGRQPKNLPGFSDGRIYNIRKNPEPLPEYDQALIGSFWARCNEITEQYLKL